MVNSTAEARRHAAAVKIGSVYELEYAAKSWFGLPAAKKSSDIHEKRAFLSVTRISRILSHLERSKLPVGLVRSNKLWCRLIQVTRSWRTWTGSISAVHGCWRELLMVFPRLTSDCRRSWRSLRHTDRLGWLL
jgi:hypothetical protein